MLNDKDSASAISRLSRASSQRHKLPIVGEFNSNTGISSSINSRTIERLRGHKTSLKRVKRRKGRKLNTGEKHNRPADTALKGHSTQNESGI